MLMEHAVQMFWAVVPGVIVGIVMAVWNKRQKDRENRREEHERQADRGQVLQISLLVASASLSYAVAMAIKRGKPNGEVEEGIRQYNRAMERFREYEREQVAKGARDEQ